MRFHVAYHAIYDYIVTDLSAVYMDALKDRLYSSGAKSPERRSAQTVLAQVLEVLVRQLAPILSFTCDEVWDEYPAGMKAEGRVPAVQLAGWPSVEELAVSGPEDECASILASFETIMSAREVVTKALEEARKAGTIGKSQEAAVCISAPEAVASVLRAQEPGVLEEMLIVASVQVQSVAEELGTSATVEVAAGDKCPRCWNIRELGHDATHPEVCERCAAVLSELGA
jgi:isoleucyl-tRNA synthetase